MIERSPRTFARRMIYNVLLCSLSINFPFTWNGVAAVLLRTPQRVPWAESSAQSTDSSLFDVKWIFMLILRWKGWNENFHSFYYMSSTVSSIQREMWKKKRKMTLNEKSYARKQLNSNGCVCGWRAFPLKLLKKFKTAWELRQCRGLLRRPIPLNRREPIK